MKIYNRILKNKQALIILFLTISTLSVLYLFRGNISSLGKLGIIGIFAVNFISSSTVLFPLPGAISIVVGGALYNPLAVAFAGALGASLGEIFAYMIGYSSGQIALESHRYKKKIAFIKKYFDKAAFASIFVFAAIPSPFDILGLLSGTLGYPVAKFFTATFLGRFFRSLLLAWGGGQI